MSTTTHDDFTERVRLGSGLTGARAAEQAAVAVLVELGEHLTGPAARRLGDGLPEPYALALRRAAEAARAGSLEEAFAAVERRCGLDGNYVAAAVAGVARALAETADPDALRAAREQLPAALRALLGPSVGEGARAR